MPDSDPYPAAAAAAAAAKLSSRSFRVSERLQLQRVRQISEVDKEDFGRECVSALHVAEKVRDCQTRGNGWVVLRDAVALVSEQY